MTALKAIRTPTQKKHIRASITLSCKQAVANEPRIHYSQQRPFWYYDDFTKSFLVLDCSGFVDVVVWNAMHDTSVYIHDPMDFGYRGIGNTSSLETYLRNHGKGVEEVNGYLVGDIVRWGQGHWAHTAICSKAGSAHVAEWTSHGREAGPLVVKLHYRDDLVGAWRMPELI